jgi:hypothetical protein
MSSTDLKDYQPKTHSEQDASMHAVITARKQEAVEAIADDLSQRERILLEEAFDAGYRAANTNISKVIGPAAETLNAQAMRAAANSSKDISGNRMLPFGYDETTLQIVSRTAKRLEWETT